VVLPRPDPEWLRAGVAPPLPAVASPLAPSPFVPPALATAPPPGQPAVDPNVAPAPNPMAQPFGMGPAYGAGGATPDMGPQFDNALYDSYKASLLRGRGMFGDMEAPGGAAAAPGAAPPGPAPLGGGAAGPPTTPDAAVPPMSPGPFGGAPSMPGMLGMGLPDPGQEAMQREDAFASIFPRAMEAMNRTGLWKGGTDTMARPTMPPPKAPPVPPGRTPPY
jgi:hypothetical protein